MMSHFKKMSEFLLCQHITPHSIIDRSPVELSMEWWSYNLARSAPSRSPDFKHELRHSKKPRYLQQGNLVYTRNYREGWSGFWLWYSEPLGPSCMKWLTLLAEPARDMLTNWGGAGESGCSDRTELIPPHCQYWTWTWPTQGCTSGYSWADHGKFCCSQLPNIYRHSK